MSRCRWGGVGVRIGAGLLLAVPVVALAGTRLADIDAVCPLFGHRFTAQGIVREDDVAAFDADFCKRPRGGVSAYVLAVWTCPYCFFSAYQADFRGTLDPRFRDLELRSYPLDAAKVEQVNIFVGTKYLNAETYYRVAGKDARFLADLMLRGSYACRVFQLAEPPEYEGLHDALRAEAEGGRERLSVEELNLSLVDLLRGRLADPALAPERGAVLRYHLAEALRQSGGHREAAAVLEELLRDRGLPDAYRSQAVQRKFLCDKEREFQERALSYFREAEGMIPPSERGLVTYLQAELERRLGRFEEARTLYERAASYPPDPAWLTGMIRKQRDRLPATGPGEQG